MTHSAPNTAALRFAIFGNVYRDDDDGIIQQVCSSISMHGCRWMLFSDTHERMRALGVEPVGGEVFRLGEELEADFAVSVGGDGTLLRTVEHIVGRNIPVIGVNTGRLGFLADEKADSFDTVVDALQQRRYHIEHRGMLAVGTHGGPLTDSPYALNDVAILKHDGAAMLAIRTYLDGEMLVTYQADGLVVCTPTGSTAYSLSNGGPIIMPQTDVVCLTPIAPHSLNVRPLIVASHTEIRLEVESRSKSFLVAIDGRPTRLEDSVQITIIKAPCEVDMVKTEQRTYISTLRKKMMWGADNRNLYHEED